MRLTHGQVGGVTSWGGSVKVAQKSATPKFELILPPHVSPRLGQFLSKLEPGQRAGEPMDMETNTVKGRLDICNLYKTIIARCAMSGGWVT